MDRSLKLAMASFYKRCLEDCDNDETEVEDNFENVKEIGIRMAQLLGVWCCTKSLCDLAVGVIAAKTHHSWGTDACVENIDGRSLGASNKVKRLSSLNDLDVQLRARILFEAEIAVRVLESWLWAEVVELENNDLFLLCRDSLMFLEDVIFLLQAGSALKDQEAATPEPVL